MAAHRKIDYWVSPEGLSLLEAWTRDGATITEIAGKIGVSRETLSRWASANSHICHALERSREIVDSEVEAALYKCCVGMDATETITDYDAEGNVKSTRIITRHIPPNFAACRFWLVNRKSGKWSDRPLQAPEEGAQTGVVLMPMIADYGEGLGG